MASGRRPLFTDGASTRLLPMYFVTVAVYLLSDDIDFIANMNGGYLPRSLSSWIFVSGMMFTDSKPICLILCIVF
ncbi:hypothetical protein [Sodalis-like endosymbiont of Proechinophthirus fluctus]|uniref:hypothetical protein n=1 Tax=Sodalis-like endosymbiont of Proechinophthirus fluctus TaxID=1462730 RepID=UPI000B2AE83C|nr:hypothetical protein [Sodalis-like endosymbiont of Proechinophthirus fluctus]